MKKQQACFSKAALNKINLKNSDKNSQLNISNEKVQMEEKPKLKIIRNDKNTNNINNQIKYLDYNIPFIMIKKSKFDKEENKCLVIKSKILNYSMKKLKPITRVLSGKTLNHALKISETLTSKGASIAKDYLDKINKISEEENKHELKYFYIVKEAFLGKKTGTRKPFPRAKGKADIRVSAKCRINFKIMKVPAKDYLKKLALGETDMTFAEAQKCKLFENNASLNDIKKNAFFLTSKGRNYRATQFKRLIFYLKNRYYESHKIKLSSLFIAEEIKKNLGQNLLAYMNMLPTSPEEYNSLSPNEKAKSEIRESFYETFVQKLSKQQETTLDLEKRRNLYNEKMRNFQ